MPRHVLILGGSSFIGKHLVAFFKKEGHVVTATTSKTLNLLDADAVAKYFVSLPKPFDLVVHCCAVGGSRLQKDTDTCFHDNVRMLEYVLRQRERYGKLVYISSGAAENARDTQYGLSKHVAESLLTKELNAYCMRVFGCFGIGEPATRLLSSAMSKAKAGEVMQIDDRPFDFIAVSDLCKLVSLLLPSAALPSLPKAFDAVYATKHTLSSAVALLASPPSVNIRSSGNSPYIGDTSGDVESLLGSACLGLKAGVAHFEAEFTNAKASMNETGSMGSSATTRFASDEFVEACSDDEGDKLQPPGGSELLATTKALPGMYAQYDKAGKHWYAPNKFEAYGEEEIQGVVSALRDGYLAPGPRTEEFERQVAALFGKEHGLMVNSGSSANLIALAAGDFPAGGEVVTPACTFSTTVAPLVQLGLKPVFVDVQLGTIVPTARAVLAVITPKTVLIWLPNLVGSKPDWEELRKQTSLPLWEDSCDCITYTKESHLAITSFYASHMITAGGQGGMIMHNDKAFIDKCRMYRDWGRIGNNSEEMVERFGASVDGIPYDGKFLYGVVGYNMKASEMNAAFGLVQLTRFDTFREIRRANFKRFLTQMRAYTPRTTSTFGLPEEPLGTMDWLAFPLRSAHRSQLLPYLENHNIQTRVCFAGNITRHPAYKTALAYPTPDDFPNSDTIMAEGFLLGCHHGTTFAQIDRACELLKAFEVEVTRRPPKSLAPSEVEEVDAPTAKKTRTHYAKDARLDF